MSFEKQVELLNELEKSTNLETKADFLKMLTDYVAYWDEVYQDARSESKETCVQYGEKAMNGDRKAREHITRAFEHENMVLAALCNAQTALEIIKPKEVTP